MNTTTANTPPKRHTVFDTFFLEDPGIIPLDEKMKSDPLEMNCWRKNARCVIYILEAKKEGWKVTFHLPVSHRAERDAMQRYIYMWVYPRALAPNVCLRQCDGLWVVRCKMLF